MYWIKTYLLPLFLVLIVSCATYGQSTTVVESKTLSKADSVLVNYYYSEQDYNELHAINSSAIDTLNKQTYSDETYKDLKYKKRKENDFWEDVPIEFIVDVAVNTFFFVALLWQ
jgi:hypothetical protein